jgi:uncharacterized protein (DUF697 family)
VITNIRNLYKILSESRTAAERRATLAVLGDSPAADEIAAVLGAQRSVRGAEVVICVLGPGESTPSGVEPVLTVSIGSGPGDVVLAGTTEQDIREDLIPRLLDEVDEDYLLPLGRAYESLRRPVCEKIVRNNARQNAVIGALPIPGADMPVMTANQARMVLSIAAVYGEELSLERARELVGVVAAGFGLRALSRQLVKFIPFGGWAAAAAIAYSGTLAMGRASILYFERGKEMPGEEEMERIRAQAEEEARRYGGGR